MFQASPIKVMTSTLAQGGGHPARRIRGEWRHSEVTAAPLTLVVSRRAQLVLGFSPHRGVESLAVPRKPKAPPPAAPPGSYAEWRVREVAVLERRGILPGVMREREWRQLFIAGATPEEAAARADTENHNRRPPGLGRRGR